MQTKLAIQLDNIFKYIVIFCIFFIWTNYYYTNFLGCVILSILFTSIACFILTKIFYIKNDKKIKTKNEAIEYDQTIHQLLFMKQDEILNYFYLVLKTLDFDAKSDNFTIILNNKTILPYFVYELSIDDFLKIYKKYKSKKLIILTNKVSSELNSFISNFDLEAVEIMTSKDVYNTLIKPSKLKPQITVKAKELKKLTAIKFCQHAFNKKNARSYFLSGILIMFSSLFYKYSLYYQIVGTILFGLSLYSKFNTRFNQPTSNNTFK